MTIASNNKRIATNTMFLYIRMFVMMAVSLFTSRIVLDALGETDYGIYNIVGSVVILFSFLNSALTAATQRFLNYYLGEGNTEQLAKVFCMSMNSYIILSAIFLVGSETAGLWFFHTQLSIPAERMAAANWAYQFSVLTFIINLIRIPYNASIIAYERMDFYAYASLVEVILKLVVVYALFIDGIDRLIVYSLLYALIPLVLNAVYKIYCNKKFKITRFKLMWDKQTFKALFSFSGWSLFGSIANLLAQQGLLILINIFFGVAVNAAVGIANNIASYVMNFTSNFQIAFQPQIVKLYASNQTEAFHKLIFRASKFSFFLIFILSFPIILTAQTLLDIWLVNVPQHTATFCQLILVFLIMEATAAPLWMAVQATGKIKRYQIWMASCILLNFPLMYLFFKAGMPVYTAWLVRIAVQWLTITVRLLYMRKYMSFSISRFIHSTLVPIVKVLFLTIPIPLYIALSLDKNIMTAIVIISISLLLGGTCTYKFGLLLEERNAAKEFIRKKILKH